MRVSKEKQEETKLAILKSTAKLSKDSEFKSITMKAIAKEAGIGEATIYNYFATKESLIFGYFENTLRKSIEQVESEGVDDFKFTEIIHSLIEAQLELMQDDEEFVKEVFQYLFVNPLFLGNSVLAESKKLHFNFTERCFEQALSRGEFKDPPFRSLIFELIWDFHVGVIYYWIKDESSNKDKTTEMTDLALQLFAEVLSSDLFGKIYGLSHFLIKEHLMNKLLSVKGH